CRFVVLSFVGAVPVIDSSYTVLTSFFTLYVASLGFVSLSFVGVVHGIDLSYT
ncbi:12646_t:CDS:2, partial [Gigaspora margarita]